MLERLIYDMKAIKFMQFRMKIKISRRFGAKTSNVWKVYKLPCYPTSSAPSFPK